MRRTLHYLRIAVTALSLTACVLLVALWVRSYRQYDAVIQHGMRTMIYSSRPGGFVIEWCNFDTTGENDAWAIESYAYEISPPDSQVCNIPSVLFNTRRADVCIRVPFWLPLMLIASSMALTWKAWKWRFSLRTLLFTTTLVAVGLGLVIYVAR